MSAAKKIELQGWGESGWEVRDSEREYIETEGTFYSEEVGDYYRSTERRHAPLYLDPATGLVVFDIPAYERWVR